MPADGQVAFASVAARLAGRYREQSAALVGMAQAVLDGNWPEYLSKAALWAQIEAKAKHDADLMMVLLRGLDAGTIKDAVKATGLTADQAAAIIGMGGCDGWD